MPHLADRLGPVAALTYRLASRIVNSLRAGYAVKDAASLAECRLVVVRVPHMSLAQAVDRLAYGDWTGKTVLLWESGADSGALDPLRVQGASAGCVNPIEGCANCYVVEGDPAALRQAKLLVRALSGKAIELDRRHMVLYETGLTLASSLFTPLIAAAVECLGAGARKPASAARVATTLFQKSLHAWDRQGRQSWNGPLAAGDEAVIHRQLRALERVNPHLARYYRNAARFALEYFARHPELKDRL
ncbi:MAG: DUF2520 domain-containing protein [Bryobacteraceae bacterium]